jgi:hypothetical protein
VPVTYKAVFADGSSVSRRVLAVPGKTAVVDLQPDILTDAGIRPK